MMKNTLLVASLLLCGTIQATHILPQPGDGNHHIPLKRLADSLRIPQKTLYIRIIKKDYLLQVLTRNHDILKSYPVALGFNPIDDKLREGDGCTPEGWFRLRAIYHHASWSRFMWISYPDRQSRIKHEQAERAGRIPRNTPMGGEVGIHGVPQGMDHLVDQRRNWTLGCISLRTRDILDLYAVCYPGMPVHIVNER
jgi:murein L,D-transpeptidase YafK